MLLNLLISLCGIHVSYASVSPWCELNGRCFAPQRESQTTRAFGTLSLSLSSNQIIENEVKPSRSTSWIVSLRGGDEDTDSADEEEVEEKAESLDQDDDDDEEEGRSTQNEDAESDEEQEKEEETDEEEESSTNPKAKQTGGPIKLIVKTGLNSPLIDQTWESTCSRTRTIASIKQSLARQMRGRPPASLQRLLLNGVQELRDDVILDDILPKESEEDEDEDDDEEDQGMVKLQLLLDMPPPIDAKFAAEYEEMLRKMTKPELIDAYAANMAVLSFTTESLLNLPTDENEVQEEEKQEGDEETSSLSTVGQSATLTMRKHALLIKELLMSTLSDEIRQSVENDDRTEEQEKLEEENSSLKKRVGIQGGAAMNVKRVVQYNLNIDWADTIRNSLLFLFFGFLGAKDPISRMLMMGAAPMCFIIQARPVKIVLKQLFYAIGKPPAVILSLLPAPQQAVMSLDYDAVMKDLYGSNYAASEKPSDEEAENEEEIDELVDDDESEQVDENEYDDDEYE